MAHAILRQKLDAAMEQALRSLRHSGRGDAPGQPLFGFGDFCRGVGFEAVWEFERQWGPGKETSP